MGAKCYKFVGKGTQLKWNDAAIACSQSLSGNSLQKPRLIQFDSEDELRSLVEIMLYLGNMDPIWLNAYRNSEYFSRMKPITK